MKKIIKYTSIFAIALFLSVSLYAQQPPHPAQNGNGSNVGGGPVGGGAPIDGGLSFLLIAGAAYGTKKVYKAFKNK